MEEWLIGVDEAGRGPLAGPVAVGIVAVVPGFDVAAEFTGVNDSKLMKPRERERIFAAAEERALRGDLRYAVRLSTHAYIDRYGITRAVRRALWSGVRSLAEPDNSTVLLDGLLRAPRQYFQRTIIGGDSKAPIISLASVLAKVTRDRLMERLSERYPEYGFEQHKGYGTPEHRLAIAHYGLCDIHRQSYCKAATE